MTAQTISSFLSRYVEDRKGVRETENMFSLVEIIKRVREFAKDGDEKALIDGLEIAEFVSELEKAMGGEPLPVGLNKSGNMERVGFRTIDDDLVEIVVNACEKAVGPNRNASISTIKGTISHTFTLGEGLTCKASLVDSEIYTMYCRLNPDCPHEDISKLQLVRRAVHKTLKRFGIKKSRARYQGIGINSLN